MHVQHQAKLALLSALGSSGLLIHTQAFRSHQCLLRSRTSTTIDITTAAAATTTTIDTRRTGGGVGGSVVGGVGRLFSASASTSSSMSSSAGERGPIILGSKSFTRRMIIEEMGFTPITR